MSVKYVIPLQYTGQPDSKSSMYGIEISLYDTAEIMVIRVSLDISCSSRSPLPTACKFVATIYDDMWYCIGKTRPFPLDWQQAERASIRATLQLRSLYGDSSTNKELKHADFLRRINISNKELMNGIYVEVIIYDDEKTSSDIVEHQQINTMPDFNNQWRFHPPANTRDLTFELRGDDEGAPHLVECDKLIVESLVNCSEYFKQCVHKTSGEPGRPIEITRVDAGIFQRMIDFLHYGKYVYLMTDRGRQTLQECCRDILVIANRFLCNNLASECAECITKVTNKDSIFSDIYLLTIHYNREDKMSVISQMGHNIRRLQPDGKAQQLKVLCEQQPEVAAGLLDKLTAEI